MPKYNINKLGPKEFEELCQSLVQKIIGPGAKIYGMGKDGSREVTFEGKAPYPSIDEQWDGKWIFQAKFHDIDRIGTDKARMVIKKDIKKELKKITKKYEYECDNYILITNVPLSPVHGTGTKDTIDNDILPEFKEKIPNIHIWGAEEVERHLDAYPEIRRSYSHLLVTGDVISRLLDNIEKPEELATIRQRKIYNELKQIDERAAEAYSGGINTFKNEKHLERIPQSANSLILICKLINKIKDNIFKVSELLPQPVEDRKKTLFSRLKDLCESFEKISNHELSTTEEEYEEKIFTFEYTLSEILRPNLEILDDLDNLLKKEIPTQQDIKKLIKLLNKPSLSQYFFSRLSSPKWIDLLIENNFYSEPKAESIEGFLMVSIWPQVNYLIKISQFQPDIVLSIIKDLADSKNYRIYRSLLQCIFKMPVRVSKKSLPIIENWTSNFCSTSELIFLKKLVNKFIDEEDTDSAFNLIDILFSVKEPKIKIEYGGLDNKFNFLISDYEDFIEKIINVDIKNSSNRFLKILCNTFSEFLASASDVNNNIYKDYSEVWRPTIESIPHAYETRDIKNYIINEIRDYFKRVAEKNPDLLKSCYDLLSNYKWDVFTRIQLYLINKFHDLLYDKLKESLTQQAIFENTSYWVEYYDLLKNHFSKLSNEDRELIFNWIRNGPDFTKYRLTPEDFSSEDEFLKWKERKKANWIKRRANPIKEHLPTDLKDLYTNLISESGELEHPQYYRYLEGPRFFSGSPLNIEQIESFSTKELIDYLKNWSPDEKEFDVSEEGLGAFISRIITKNPSKYRDLINDFGNIPLTYLPYVIDGFSNAIKKEKKFNILEIISIIFQIFKNYEREGEIESFINIWKEITKFLNESLNLKDIRIPKEMIKEIWELISIFLNIKESGLDSFDKKDSGYENYFYFSINTFKGKVLETLFKYSLYCARILNLPEDKKMVPEVKDKLEELLNPEIESVKIIRSIVAYHLYDIFYLDKQWASTKIPVIFPEDIKELWRIAWESYISYSNLHGYIYPLMRNHYKIAVTQLGSPLFSNRALEGLTSHIILTYIYKFEDFDENSIATLFFSNANSQLRSRAMWFTIKVYDSVVNIDERDKVLDRILEIWEYRIREAKNNTILTSKDKYDEFRWYGLLFEKLDIRDLHLQILLNVLDLTEGNLDVFTNFILEILKNYIKIDAQKVLSAIKKLLKGDVSIWLNINTENIIIDIIKGVNKIYNIQDFKDILRGIADLLIEKGFFKIKELDFLTELGS